MWYDTCTILLTMIFYRSSAWLNYSIISTFFFQETQWSWQLTSPSSWNRQTLTGDAQSTLQTQRSLQLAYNHIHPSRCLMMLNSGWLLWMAACGIWQMLPLRWQRSGRGVIKLIKPVRISHLLHLICLSKHLARKIQPV